MITYRTHRKIDYTSEWTTNATTRFIIADNRKISSISSFEFRPQTYSLSYHNNVNINFYPIYLNIINFWIASRSWCHDAWHNKHDITCYNTQIIFHIYQSAKQQQNKFDWLNLSHWFIDDWFDIENWRTFSHFWICFTCARMNCTFS